MKPNLIPALALCAGLAAAPVQAAVNLTFTNPANVALSSLFDIEVVVTGLEDSDLGAFDFDVTFDPGVVGFADYELGDELGVITGDVFTTEAFDLSDTSNAPAGSVRMAETSLLIDLSSQPDAFTLATLTFEALAVGTAGFGLMNVALSDALGGEIEAAVPGQVQVVPLPPAMALLGVAAGGLLAFRRRATA